MIFYTLISIREGIIPLIYWVSGSRHTQIH